MLAAGLSVIFFAGLSWKLIVPPVLVGVVAVTLIVGFESQLCADGVDWRVLHEYQKQRVCTLLDPTKDLTWVPPAGYAGTPNSIPDVARFDSFEFCTP